MAGSMNGPGKEKSLEFLTSALTEVGFSPTHARRACLATSLAGVPQAIEWALAHLDEEVDPAFKELAGKLHLPNAHTGGGGTPSSSRNAYRGNSIGMDFGHDKGLVVELPDGKLFKLKNINGRVVEMPNGSVVEMVDGQVVEMSNGQQLEMVDGSLIEIRPASQQLDEGEVVGHRVMDLETSRRVAGSAAAASGQSRHATQDTSSHSRQAYASDHSTRDRPLPGDRISDWSSTGDMAESERRQFAEKEERLRRQHMQVLSKEEQINMQAQQLSERDKHLGAKQQLVMRQEQGLRAQEEVLLRQRASVQAEQEAISQQTAALKKKDAELQAREAQLQQSKAELSRLRDQLRDKERELREREAAVQAAAANGASGASTASAPSDAEGDEGRSALDNIEAGRIRFSELTLGSLLGSGSFADVYRAEWRMPCAVKKMKGRISKEMMTEFVREGEMMRSLKHPGIVKLLGVCVEGGSFYLVQEIVNGFGNLFDYLHKKKARLTYWQCIQIAIGICDAMAYLHERHIVHRDLKPQNCLLVNERGEVKLCDFGLARLKNAAFVETVSNTAGTPAYQAPEMLRDEPISEKVDLYGFGIMLWEMYTGKLPWSDKNYHQMIHTVAVRNERPPCTPDMPRELVAIIEGCWHPTPAKRPAFSELRAVFRDLTKSVAPDVAKPPAPPPAQPPPAPVVMQQPAPMPAAQAPVYYMAGPAGGVRPMGMAPGMAPGLPPPGMGYAPMVYGAHQAW